jgi:hypothetical protein
VTDRWFSLVPPVSSNNNTDRHDIIEILLKVAFITINLTLTLILEGAYCLLCIMLLYQSDIRCRRGRERMVVGFTTTYAISAYHHAHGEGGMSYK